jgi:hypothetical protein
MPYLVFHRVLTFFLDLVQVLIRGKQDQGDREAAVCYPPDTGKLGPTGGGGTCRRVRAVLGLR